MGYLTKSAIVIAVIAALLVLGPMIYKEMDQREFGRKTTAEYAAKGNNFKNKVAIVTGSSSGIGISTAKVLYENDATVIMACRNKKKANKVRKKILKQVQQENPNKRLDESKLKVLVLDLGSLESVDSFVSTFLDKYKKLNILINNAGVMGNDEFGVTSDGIEQQFGINVVGHHLLTLKLTPLLIESSNKGKGKHISRIINVASMAYMSAPSNIADYLSDDGGNINNPLLYSPMQRYGLTKACNIIFAAEHNRRYRDKGVYSVSLHPGAIKTGLQQYNFWLGLWNKYVPEIGLKTQSEGAATSIRAASMSDEEFIKYSGKYFEDCNPASLWRSDILDGGPLGILLFSMNEKLIKKHRMAKPM